MFNRFAAAAAVDTDGNLSWRGHSWIRRVLKPKGPKFETKGREPGILGRGPALPYQLGVWDRAVSILNALRAQKTRLV